MLDSELLREIEPKIQIAYEDHMQSIKDKSSDDPTAYKRPFSPVSQLATVAGTNTDPLEYGPVLRKDYETTITDFGETYGVDVRPVLASSFLVNLLTEDNLPHYTSRIHGKVSGSEALMRFANEWTAEEDTHGVIMRDYALLTGLIGDRETSLISNANYDAGRTSQLRNGTEIDPSSLQVAFAYLSLQEHLTKEAHKKLGWILPKMGQKVMNPIVGDEQNHYEFYRKLSEESLRVDPDGSLIAMNDVYNNFSMPGAVGIPDFNKHSLVIGLSGIFDLETIALSQQIIANKLSISSIEPTTYEGKQAQEQLLAITSNEAIAEQKHIMESFRDLNTNEQPNGLAPFILGKTIDFDYVGAPGHQRPAGLKPIKS